MKILISGICGFVGASLARWFRQYRPTFDIVGIDNFIRPGSETNRLALRSAGVAVSHGDIRSWSDFETLPSVDWVIDAAANPSVLAGIDGLTSSRQVVEHNLHGTLNLLEYCKRVKAGLVLLSTSRVYSIRKLQSLPLVVRNQRFELDGAIAQQGISANGVDVDFSTAPPISLYGSTKFASEILALEYANAFSLPVWINRCGVMAGAGQFGTAEQGIFSFWVHAFAQKRPMKYLGFGGSGHQVRDALHPDDLADLIVRQTEHRTPLADRLFNVGGGIVNSMSLAELSSWCDKRFGTHRIESDMHSRTFDIPWLVMDNHRATEQFKWRPQRTINSILDEIADHAMANPDWLNLSSPK